MLYIFKLYRHLNTDHIKKVLLEYNLCPFYDNKINKHKYAFTIKVLHAVLCQTNL